MSFQYTPEHFSAAPSHRQQGRMQPSAGRLSAQESVAQASSEPGVAAIETIMVQTPNGAAMRVPVRRRPDSQQSLEQTDKSETRQCAVHVLERAAMTKQQSNGMPLPHSVSCHVRVAAAPER